MHIIQRIFEMPLVCITMATIPYKNNVLMNTPLALAIHFLSFALIIVLFGIEVRFLYLVVASSILAVATFFVFKLKVLKPYRQRVNLILALLTILSWLRIIISCLLDFLLLFSFMFSIEEVLVFIIVISIGNSLGDLFTNISLSQQGMVQLAFLSILPSMILNQFVGFSLNLIFSKDTEFDLYGIHSHRRGMGKIYLTFLFGFVFLVMGAHFGYARWTGYKYGRRVVWLLVPLYFLFFGFYLTCIYFYE